MEIRNNIKVLRAKNNMTQDDLAVKVGATRQTILAIEKQKYYPTLGLAFRIAKTFHVGIEDVFYLNNKDNER